MKSAPTDPTAAPPGQVCPRCSRHVRPDWNFCPTCSLPSRPEEEVLSTQIRVLRRAAGEGARAPTSALLRWIVGGTAAALVLGTLAIGVALFVPRAAPMLQVDPPDPAVQDPVAVAETPGLAYVFEPVPGGEFRTGPPDGPENWSEIVDVPGFEILRYEITNAQWMEYLVDRREALRKAGMYRDAVPSYWKWSRIPGAKPPDDEEPVIPGDEGGTFPLRGVSFEQAVEFCRWLDSTGRIRGARLPREEEWEKAARGTDGRIYPWGGGFLVKEFVAGGQVEIEGAWVSRFTPREVHRTDFDVSPYKCVHMGGNVSEWTDLWGGSSPDAPGPWDRYRVVRGASFQQNRKDGADSARTWAGFTDREKGIGALDVGFRIARDLAEPEPAGGK